MTRKTMLALFTVLSFGIMIVPAYASQPCTIHHPESVWNTHDDIYTGKVIAQTVNEISDLQIDRENYYNPIYPETIKDVKIDFQLEQILKGNPPHNWSRDVPLETFCPAGSTYCVLGADYFTVGSEIFYIDISNGRGHSDSFACGIGTSKVIDPDSNWSLLQDFFDYYEELYGDSPPTYPYSPYKQMKMGYPLEDIQCNDDKVLMQFPSGKPACVYEDTAKKLENRGWKIIENEISLIEYEFPLSASSLYDNQNNFDEPTAYYGDIDLTISNLPKIGETAEIEITFTSRVDFVMPNVNNPDSPWVNYTSMQVIDLPPIFVQNLHMSDHFEFVNQTDIISSHEECRRNCGYGITKLADTVFPNQTITMSATIKAVSEGFASIAGSTFGHSANISVHVGNDQTILTDDYLAMHPRPSLPLVTGQSSEPKIYEKLRAMINGTADYSGGTSNATLFKDIPEDELRALLEEGGLTPEEIEEEIRKAHPKVSTQSFLLTPA